MRKTFTTTFFQETLQQFFSDVLNNISTPADVPGHVLLQGIRKDRHFVIKFNLQEYEADYNNDFMFHKLESIKGEIVRMQPLYMEKPAN